MCMSASVQLAPPSLSLALQGDLFKRLIKGGGVLDEKFVVTEVILPLLVTLEHLHNRKILHRCGQYVCLSDVFSDPNL